MDIIYKGNKKLLSGVVLNSNTQSSPFFFTGMTFKIINYHLEQWKLIAKVHTYLRTDVCKKRSSHNKIMFVVPNAPDFLSSVRLQNGAKLQTKDRGCQKE